MDYSSLKIPNHVAIILDGNGRWAQERNLNRSKGHEAGLNNLRNLTRYIFSRGIKILSVFVFSTENFQRSKSEVDYLMKLFLLEFRDYSKKYMEDNIKVIFSGRKEPLKKSIINAMLKLEKMTENNTGGILNICLNYGGKSEIVDTTKNIVSDVLNNKIKVEEINEDMFSNYLYKKLEPIDFLIRTSGENRISNFMLWQLSYAEFYFPETYFPDFSEKEFDKAILEYNNRDRRFGKIKYNNGE